MFALMIVLRHLLPDTPLATYTYILVSYHLVLAFKVFTSEKKSGLSLPVGQAIVTHLACVGLIVGMAMGRHVIPFFGIIRYFIPGIAPFEANWLFNGEKKVLLTETGEEQVRPLVPAAAPAQAAPAVAVSANDYDDFVEHMRAGKRPFRKAGMSVKQEFELWAAHRAQARAAEQAAAQAAAPSSTASVRAEAEVTA